MWINGLEGEGEEEKKRGEWCRPWKSSPMAVHNGRRWRLWEREAEYSYEGEESSNAGGCKIKYAPSLILRLKIMVQTGPHFSVVHC